MTNYDAYHQKSVFRLSESKVPSNKSKNNVMSLCQRMLASNANVACRHQLTLYRAEIFAPLSIKREARRTLLCVAQESKLVYPSCAKGRSLTSQMLWYLFLWMKSPFKKTCGGHLYFTSSSTTCRLNSFVFSSLAVTSSKYLISQCVPLSQYCIEIFEWDFFV